MQRKNNIKEILKPLVRKILLENEIFPDEKGSPGHREEAPKSNTAAMGTGNEKVKKVAHQVLAMLEELILKLVRDELTVDGVETYIKENIVEGTILHNLGPRAHIIAAYLLNSDKFKDLIKDIEKGTGTDYKYLFGRSELMNQFDKFDDIDESLINEVFNRLRNK